ncbi:MAG TPA: hypothetical protein VMS22_14460 [Candidatus Eisenbacteria bacterium]|nr:hypothetical protein [Candidatus Eisenbacteria bacterium]
MEPSDRNPTHPADRAFVVRFRANADPTLERVDGQVEHVVSGRTVRFGSYAEIVVFIQRVLAEQRAAAARSA